MFLLEPLGLPCLVQLLEPPTLLGSWPLPSSIFRTNNGLVSLSCCLPFSLFKALVVAWGPPACHGQSPYHKLISTQNSIYNLNAPFATWHQLTGSQGFSVDIMGPVILLISLDSFEHSTVMTFYWAGYSLTDSAQGKGLSSPPILQKTEAWRCEVTCQRPLSWYAAKPRLMPTSTHAPQKPCSWSPWALTLSPSRAISPQETHSPWLC